MHTHDTQHKHTQTHTHTHTNTHDTWYTNTHTHEHTHMMHTQTNTHTQTQTYTYTLNFFGFFKSMPIVFPALRWPNYHVNPARDHFKSINLSPSLSLLQQSWDQKQGGTTLRSVAHGRAANSRALQFGRTLQQHNPSKHMFAPFSPPGRKSLATFCCKWSLGHVSR